MKHIISSHSKASMGVLALSVTLSGLCLANDTKAQDTRNPAMKSFIDYFLPSPVIGTLSKEAWGAAHVGERDQKSGLEEADSQRWNYGDGQLIKSKEGRYNSNSRFGPYKDNGLLYSANQGDKGHNVSATRPPDGRYAKVPEQNSTSRKAEPTEDRRPRVIVTTDGEEDDRCSMVRFLLTSNEFKVEGIVNSSSQFHWVGGKGWNVFHPASWVKDYIDLYAKVYDNLRLHDPNYPTPDYLLSRWKVGNISAAGEDELRTEGAEWIAKVLLDDSDSRPIWIQAWGGCNTISRALKIIQEDHPSRMKEVAGKLRLFLIWEQDKTYQDYIRPNWERFNIPTVISDQFDCMAYIWPKVLPGETKTYFEADWMKAHILNGKGPLCSAYEHKNGAFRAEGDTPSFLHTIPNGLRSVESPDWGGWGGRYVNIRNNVWMDPAPIEGWEHPDGQLSIHNSWSKQLENVSDPKMKESRTQYFKPIWRWLDDVQNDFAARADWCVKDYASANHHPIVRLKNTPLDLDAVPGQKVTLDATATTDPDGDTLNFRWWHYSEAGTYSGAVLPESDKPKTRITIPNDARPGDTIHMICEVTDAGSPPLTRYQRVVIHVRAR